MCPSSWRRVTPLVFPPQGRRRDFIRSLEGKPWQALPTSPPILLAGCREPCSARQEPGPLGVSHSWGSGCGGVLTHMTLFNKGLLHNTGDIWAPVALFLGRIFSSFRTQVAKLSGFLKNGGDEMANRILSPGILRLQTHGNQIWLHWGYP